MPEALSNTGKPVSSPAKSSSSSSLLELGGGGLLAYGIYNVVAVLLSGGVGPEAVLARMGQLVALFPVLLLGPVLIFAPKGSMGPPDGPWKTLVRWLVLLLALSYLLFVPLSFLNEFTILKTDANVVQRLETTLSNRRQEIMASVAGLADAESFRRALSRFPEISNVRITTTESPTEIRKGILGGIDQGIRQQLDQLRAQQRSRRDAFRSAARQTALGSLVCGITMMALASRLVPWLAPAGYAVGGTVTGITNPLLVLPKQLGRSIGSLQQRLQLGYQRWGYKRQGHRSRRSKRNSSHQRRR